LDLRGKINFPVTRHPGESRDPAPAAEVKMDSRLRGNDELFIFRRPNMAQDAFPERDPFNGKNIAKNAGAAIR